MDAAYTKSNPFRKTSSFNQELTDFDSRVRCKI